ncbi:hypothetical protein B0A55_04741 [Friedmanniomyces simplex]|uniref:Yeast cell wall synthesis Kre9/Knh1-like N-terminal domain-containing protein n=1 Tax=Friedmanniomyces simplex TaxID=329884 RepID=A0A4U0XPE1_9PEZI|nr:hypothetical protein B0A55_04741 [Friedmanniomyces simplex]
MYHWHASTPIVGTLLLRIGLSLSITSPTAGENVSLAEKSLITWEEEAGDATAVSVDLLNATAVNTHPILENIAHNLNTSSGQVNITWPLSVPNDTATYQLCFIATVSGEDIVNSEYFNLTLPADAQDDSDRKERIDSGELEGDTKGYLRYELPSTPPPPAELEDNEIAAAEMPSPNPNDAKHDSLRIGDWPLQDALHPTPRRLDSVRSGRTSGALSVRSGSTTLGGRDLSFAEALHKILAPELRRKG